MRKENVPQDVGLAGPMREVVYAVDEDGRYEAVPSYGWDPKTVALRQAWERILAELATIADKVARGELSPLAWHMTRHQMTPALLAKYVRINRWRIRRHMKAKPFRQLEAPLLERYAEVFGIPAADLTRIPEDPDLEFTTHRKAHGNSL